MMRVVHFVQFGPRACGLYETTKDLILAERRLGVDACLVDVDGDQGEKSRVGLRDGEIVTQDPAIAYDADVLIRHTAIPSHYQNIGKPIIMCLHGRPDSSYRLNAQSGNDVIQAVANKAHDERYKAFVYFWPEFEAAWRILVGDKLHYVPAPVDVEYYAGGADKGLAGTHKILIADIWRDDVIPLESLFGAARYVEKYEPSARIHLVGLPDHGKELAALQPFLNGLRDKIGSASGHMRNIRDWYASCDVLVTPHTIATRVIRESLAAGLPVVAAKGCQCTDYRADPRSPDEVAEAIADCLRSPTARATARETAREEFCSRASGQAMIDLCQQVASKPPTGHKIFVDVGAHLGESVRRFYRERTDASEFEIYCFEPDPRTFDKLLANVGMMPNVHCLCAALGACEESRSLQRGTVNEGEGSTLLAGKVTGGVGRDAVTVRCLDAARWLRDHPAPLTIVKINAEGGEYEILPRLVQSGAMNQVTELYVQFHSLKFDLVPRMKFDAIEALWRREMQRFSTRVYATTKGMASFAHGNPGTI